jgi:hypothetical protein
MSAPACDQGNREITTARGSPVSAVMEDLCHPQTSKAQQRNHPLDTTVLYPTGKLCVLVNWIYYKHKPPMASHPTPAGYMTHDVVDYTLSPFSCKPSAPHYVPCFNKFAGVKVEFWTPWSLQECIWIEDQVSDTWTLQLEAVRRVHLTITYEFYEEIHMLGVVQKTVAQHHGDRTDSSCWDRSS